VGRICDLRGGGVGRNFEPPDVQGDSVSDTAKEEKEEEEEESTACVIREALALLQLWDPSFLKSNRDSCVKNIRKAHGSKKTNTHTHTSTTVSKQGKQVRYRPQATAAAVTVGRCAAVIATAGTMPATAIIVLSSSSSSLFFCLGV